MKHFRTLLFAAAILIAGAPHPARAATITWFLENVGFSDGSTATGSFTYDSGYANILNYNIAVSGGSLSSETYNATQSGAYTSGDSYTATFAQDTSTLALSFESPLDSGPDTIALKTGQSYENLFPGNRSVTSGSVAIVSSPEPATAFAMLGAGGVLFALRRRRQ